MCLLTNIDQNCLYSCRIAPLTNLPSSAAHFDSPAKQPPENPSRALSSLPLSLSEHTVSSVCRRVLVRVGGGVTPLFVSVCAV